MQPRDIFDLAIIGGGINGAGIAADAAGRGLKVALFEKDDLGSGTSSASSKLIHGGLRYLEHWEFRLVREALAEREVLMARAPHLIRPLRFIIPHAEGMRSRFVTRVGLFLYDHLAARQRIPASGSVDLLRDPAGAPLRSSFSSGFSYYDCSVDDARLVVANAIDAFERGASIHTRTPVTGVVRDGDCWQVTAHRDDGSFAVAARALVNAAGPWSRDVSLITGDAAARLRLVRGTHVVIPRILGASDAYLLQNGDGRIVFALPFEAQFTMIGTTENVVQSPEDGFVASRDEEDYLLGVASRFFSQPLGRGDIVWSFAGVRPLVEDGASNASAVSRDYRLDLVGDESAPPLLNVIGGKITTFRKLAEAALDRLAPFFPNMAPAWTAGAALPGGDMADGDLAELEEQLARRYARLPSQMLETWIARYGSRTERMLGDAEALSDLGADFGAGLSEREVVYLRDNEWARTADDVLWRRTKAGLHLTQEQRTRAEKRINELLGR